MHPKLEVLIQRRNWLTARIEAKRSVGWETQWDEREWDSLSWAIEILWALSGEIEQKEAKEAKGQPEEVVRRSNITCDQGAIAGPPLNGLLGR